MKKQFIIITLLLLGFSAFAQEDASGNYQDGILLQQVQAPDGEQLQTNQNTTVHKLGFSYKEVMEQLRARVANAESENFLEISQRGHNHSAEVVQEGKRNSMEIDQKGNSNTYQGTLSGEDNLIHILQTGSFNKIYQELAGDGMELQVVQKGSGHELIQIENSGDAPNYKVEQKGEGMRIVIEHGIASFPFGNP